jgi:hypothetical protein
LARLGWPPKGPFRIGLPRRSFLADSTNAEVPMLQNYRERERLAREAVRKVLKNLPWLFTKEGSHRFYRAHMEAEDIGVLVDLARDGDKDALEFLRQYVRGLRKYARESGLNVFQIPLSVTELALEILTDGLPKAKSGPNPKDTGLRDNALAVCVKIVSQDYGFPEYTAPEHRGNPDAPMSICRLVAEEVGLSESTIEKIWAEHKEDVLRPPQ